jgi:subtilase family serine protease
VKAEFMHRFRYRAWPVLLALLFLFSGFVPASIPGVQGIARAAVYPDLIVDSIVWTPSTPSIGNNMIFTMTVKNKGNGPSGSFYLACYIDDNLESSNYANPIIAGSEMSYVFTWKAKAGDHIVRVVCDSRDDILEINEDNNDKTYAFSVLAPDLIIDGIAWTPESPSINQETTFTITVKNDGNQMATASSLLLTMDGQAMGNRNIKPLEPGETDTATYSTKATSGEHTVEAIADDLEQVREGNEINNTKTQTFFAAMPDLVVDKITWSPVNRRENENVTIAITVKNIGSGKAGFSSLGFYLDEICQTAIFIDELSVNATSVKTISLPVDAYEHTLKAIADSGGVLSETDESNNVLTIVMPALAPDLVVTGITWSPSKPVLNEYMDFTVTVKNQGKRQAGHFEVSFYVEFYHKSTQVCTSLDAGDSTTFTFPWKTLKDTVSVEAIVDELNYVNESNENNNTSRANVGFSPPAPDTDLSISSIAFNPENPLIGDAVNITVTMKNSGPGKAPPSHVAYYMDDVLLDSVYVTEMLAGSTNTIDNIIWYAEYGTHELKIVIDCNNSVFETDETNNEKTVTFTTSAPDLVIKNVTWWPINPGIGEEVNFTITIKNQGNSKAGSSYLTYYVDGSPRGNHYIEAMEAGETITRIFTWKIQAAPQVFKVIIDEDNSVPESQDYNNEKTVILPAADLLVSGITCSPEDPSENTTITFNVNFSNQGDGASPPTRAIYYFDGTEYASLDVGEIQPGMTVSDNFTWVAKAGKHVLKAVADATNLFVETNEANNAMEIVLFVPLTSTIEVPVTENVTAPAATPTPTTTVTMQKIDKTVTPRTTTTTTPVVEKIYPETTENVPETAAAEKEPMWKKILMNRLLIIAVAVVGLATISVLLMLRKRAANSEGAEKKEKPAAKKPPAEKAPVKSPPAQKPAAEKPQAQKTPAAKPPVQTSPAARPPAPNPPAQNPTAANPQAQKPPAAVPPAARPPAQNPPAQK